MRLARIMFHTVLALLIGLAGHSLGGCSRPMPFEFTRLCMGVQTQVTVHADDQNAAEAAAARAFSRIERAEQALSDYRPASDAMKLCDAAARHPGEPVQVSGDLREALLAACQVSLATDGAFSVTVGRAVGLWRQSRRSGSMPDDSERLEVVKLSDWRNVELAPHGESVLVAAGTRLDFGGIGKGYAAQAALNDLRDRGFPQSMVSLAGDIVVGDAPPGRPGWRIRVGEGSNSSGGVRDLLLVNAAISTSGDAEQFVEIDGRKYSHIVDPRTALGFPAPRGVQVTVVARDGAIADALGTAIYALPLELVPSLVTQFEAAAILVVNQADSDREIRIIDPHRLLRWAD